MSFVIAFLYGSIIANCPRAKMASKNSSNHFNWIFKCLQEYWKLVIAQEDLKWPEILQLILKEI